VDTGDDGRSHLERMAAGDLFQAFDAGVRAAYVRAQARVRAVNATLVEDVDGRRPLLLELLGSLGEASTVLPPVQCDYGFNVHLGDRVFVNFGAVFVDTREIAIGDEVLVGPGVQFLAGDHPLDAGLRRAGWESGRPISIGAGAWLGGGVIVLPGVTIGENAVIGAGSVVSRDVPAGVVAVGTPARALRAI
jgi:maltose O-acetyltransferase